MLYDERSYIWGMLDAGHLVAGQDVGPGDAVLQDVVLGEGVANAHHDPALDLALQGQRVNGPTHVVGADYS